MLHKLISCLCMKPLGIKCLFVLLLLTQTGCVTLYKPNAINTPLLKQQGDFKGTVGLGVSGTGLLNIQSAYGLTNHLGLMLNGMYHYKHSTSDSVIIGKHNQYFGEAGAGYFTAFGSRKNGVLQCFGGGGFGYTNDYYSHTDENHARSTAAYNNYFIQPGIASAAETAEVAFDLRSNYVSIFNIRSSDAFYNDTTFSFINIEPTLTLRAGGKKLKGFIQTGLTIPAHNSDAYFSANNANGFLFGPIFKFSIGLNIAVNLSKPEKVLVTTP